MLSPPCAQSNRLMVVALHSVMVAALWLSVVNWIYPGQCASWIYPLGVVNRTLFGSPMGWCGVVAGTCIGAVLGRLIRGKVSPFASLFLTILLTGTLYTTIDAVITDFNRIHLVEAWIRYGVVSALISVMVSLHLEGHGKTNHPLVCRARVAMNAILISVLLGLVFALNLEEFGGTGTTGSIPGLLATAFARLRTPDWLLIMSFGTVSLLPGASDVKLESVRSL